MQPGNFVLVDMGDPHQPMLGRLRTIADREDKHLVDMFTVSGTNPRLALTENIREPTLCHLVPAHRIQPLPAQYEHINPALLIDLLPKII